MIQALNKNDQLQPISFDFKPILIKKIDRSLVQNCMSNYAGIEKTTAGLIMGLNELTQAYQEASTLSQWTIQDWENNVLCQVGISIFKDALAQTENKGVFFNLDLEQK